ncbi:hypothetical protein ACIPRL_19135 [Streptomyces sp. NPDC090085]
MIGEADPGLGMTKCSISVAGSDEALEEENMIGEADPDGGMRDS